ncbi:MULTISPECIES: DUF2024 family protein [Shewanella]|uniref:DUF2024 family protein n=1 Tax=Shewanella salipaludis TaxID=2723052 RepID=A0A972G078_9GAMM|nr:MULTISPECIES: DUF2024 family protein [Shewanella]MCE9685716.1 DUF2024 family protein [Shewanella sp. AS16]NMH65927.1 DUF2024 family protein [Shewanella salipaludis]
MKLHVFDTFAYSKTGKILHFDVLLSERNEVKAHQRAIEWLDSIGEQGATIKPRGCTFCHTVADAPQFADEVARNGYAIYKLEGCPA